MTTKEHAKRLGLDEWQLLWIIIAGQFMRYYEAEVTCVMIEECFAQIGTGYNPCRSVDEAIAQFVAKGWLQPTERKPDANDVDSFTVTPLGTDLCLRHCGELLGMSPDQATGRPLLKASA